MFSISNKKKIKYLTFVIEFLELPYTRNYLFISLYYFVPLIKAADFDLII